MLRSLHALLNGEPPAGVVWTADISYWIAGRRQEGKADPAWDREEGYLQLCRDLRIMPYYWYDQFWLGVPEYDDSVRVTTTTTGDTTVRMWRTPAGELREELTYLPQSCSTATTRHPVQSAEDLRTLRYLLQHRWLRPDCLDNYRSRLALWASYDGLPSIALPRSPLPAFLYEWAGVECGVYLLADEPILAGEVLGLMEQQEAPVLEAVCEVAPPLVHFADNLSSSNLGSLYDRLMAEPHRRRLERLHAAGVRCAVHLDGTVKGLLPKLSANGFDAIEALTPMPAGDLSAEDMRTIANHERVILWGGVPGVIFAPPFTWHDMESHVRRVLRAWRGTPFILGVADQVPPDGEIDYCRRIADIILQSPFTISV